HDQVRAELITERRASIAMTTATQPLPAAEPVTLTTQPLTGVEPVTLPTQLSPDDATSYATVAEVPADGTTLSVPVADVAATDGTTSSAPAATTEAVQATATVAGTSAPTPSAAEVAKMQATITEAQNRMSRAGVTYRVQAIAVAEQELKTALAQLTAAQNAQPSPEDIAQAEQVIAEAHTSLQQHTAELQVADPSLQTNMDAAQLYLATLSTPVDPQVVADAQERIAAAQHNWEHVAGTASANKTAAEARWQHATLAVEQAKVNFEAGTQRYQTALGGIDPQTGVPFEDHNAELHQQQLAEELVVLDQQRVAAETEVAAALVEYELARQQEINDTASAQALLDQAVADLERANQGPSPETVAQAQAEVEAAKAAIGESEQRFAQAQSVVVDAQAVLDRAKADLEKLQSGGNPSAVVEAQGRVDQARQKVASTRQANVDASGWAWPTYGSITSGFGPRNMKVGKNHNGVDIAAAKGTPIAAARGGTVIEAGWCKGYGYCVKIAHGDGFRTEYGHLDSAPIVEAGQKVSAGTLIGRMGTSY
ncbi:MAG: hypothetical protein AVDCRST_MAG93-7979, partial [uncultured Chloroflexia bacterium]